MSGLHSADLSAVARATLEDVRAALADGRLRSPVTRTGLSALGIRHQQATIAQALAGHPQPACLAIVDVVLAERAGRGPAPELVWTGPEPSASTSR
ncbi:MAG: phospholipase, partial [Myxococcota bacterium]